MKTNTVIAGSNGERIVTSTTETLRIPASEIRPGDWLLKHHRRGLAKDRLVEQVSVGDVSRDDGSFNVTIFFALGGWMTRNDSYLVDVERTT